MLNSGFICTNSLLLMSEKIKFVSYLVFEIMSFEWTLFVDFFSNVLQKVKYFNLWRYLVLM